MSVIEFLCEILDLIKEIIIKMLIKINHILLRKKEN